MTTPLSERAKRRLMALAVIVPAFLLLLGAEIYIRVTTRYEDLWALTGRSVAKRPISDWTGVKLWQTFSSSDSTSVFQFSFFSGSFSGTRSATTRTGLPSVQSPFALDPRPISGT